MQQAAPRGRVDAAESIVVIGEADGAADESIDTKGSDGPGPVVNAIKCPTQSAATAASIRHAAGAAAAVSAESLATKKKTKDNADRSNETSFVQHHDGSRE